MFEKSEEKIPFRILIVDDEKPMGEVLSTYLESIDYEVFYASNGKAALTYTKRVRPHFILLDVKMPGMDGIETLKHILEIDPRAAVIMVTAIQEEDTGKRALKFGAVDYITKPIDFEYLRETLKIKLTAFTD